MEKTKPNTIKAHMTWPGNGTGLFSKERVREDSSKEKVKKKG